MRKVAYEFSPEAGGIIRVRFEKEGGRIHAFILSALWFGENGIEALAGDSV